MITIQLVKRCAHCRRLEQNLTSGCIAPMSDRTTLLQVPELLFLLLPCQSVLDISMGKSTEPLKTRQ